MVLGLKILLHKSMAQVEQNVGNTEGEAEGMSIEKVGVEVAKEAKETDHIDPHILFPLQPEPTTHTRGHKHELC